MDPKKEKLNNFQNYPGFVYDGRRMRATMERRMTDYSSSVIFSSFFPYPPNVSPSIVDFIPTKLAHVSVNKNKCTVNTIKWTPDGRRLISGTSTGEFTLWNGYGFNFETILQAHESAVRCLEWSPTGSFLISGDTNGSIKYWHPSMSNIQVLAGHSETVRDLSFGPFDSKFCSCSDDSLIKVWDSTQSIEELVLKGHGWDVRCVQWHPTKALIASGGKDCSIKIWDPRIENEVGSLHLHKNTVFALKWSNDGNYLLTGSKDQTIKSIDIRNYSDSSCSTTNSGSNSRQRIGRFTYRTGNKDVTSLAIHPNVNNLFVAGNNDGTINYYQMFNEDPIKTIEKGHDNIIWSMEFHPMGHVLASGSLDQSVRFWIKDLGFDDENTKNVANENINADNNLENDELSEEIPGL